MVLWLVILVHKLLSIDGRENRLNSLSGAGYPCPGAFMPQTRFQSLPA
jgi:hypothetical protein